MYPNFNKLSYDKIFAQNVKARREAMGLTRKELAEDHMGYPEELLARVESGDTTGCTIDFLVCLAEYLEAPLEALMTDRYFCPHYEMKPSQAENSQESEENEMPYINLDGEKPDYIPQEEWDRMKQVFDKIYDDESEE